MDVFRSCWNNSFVFHIWKKKGGRRGRRPSYDICGFLAHPKCHCSQDLPSWKILHCLHAMPSNCFSHCSQAWCPGHQRAQLCLQTSALEAESTTERISGIQNPKFLFLSTRNVFPSKKGTTSTQLTLPRLKSLSKMSSAQPPSPGLDLNQVSGREGWKNKRKQMQSGKKQKNLVSILEQDDLPWNMTALRHIIASFSGAFRLLASPIYFHTETRL